ncbi:hypothetical protein NC651_022116 [Populus alba x Populus x berolinensis]|nr:hypothetical protein NC651_022116 [Populus alba x Populus x berolinensis]
MYRDVSSCNTTIMETPCTGTRDTSRKLRASIGTKHYSSLRPFVRLYIPTSSRVLMRIARQDYRAIVFPDKSFDAVVDKDPGFENTMAVKLHQNVAFGTPVFPFSDRRVERTIS